MFPESRVSFIICYKKECFFLQAVYVLKSSPRLAVDVIRGAGLDLVAGESSGYNSSASSVAGDQTPPSSSSDPRDSDHSVASRWGPNLSFMNELVTARPQ